MRSWRKRVPRWNELPVLGEALLFGAYARMVARISNRATVHKVTMAIEDVSTQCGEDLLRTLIRSVTRSRKILGRGTCLTEALTLHLMLKRRGLSSTVVFGANQEENNFSAHAWVEMNGKPIFGYRNEPQYQRFE